METFPSTPAEAPAAAAGSLLGATAAQGLAGLLGCSSASPTVTEVSAFTCLEDFLWRVPKRRIPKFGGSLLSIGVSLTLTLRPNPWLSAVAGHSGSVGTVGATGGHLWPFQHFPGAAGV